MSAHTPGPWSPCGPEPPCQCLIIWSHPADSPVATAKHMVGCVHGVWGDGPGMEYGEVPAEEQQANARLIAAAPDLLEGLLHVRHSNHGYYPSACLACEAAAKAIAKAEGK